MQVNEKQTPIFCKRSKKRYEMFVNQYANLPVLKI